MAKIHLLGTGTPTPTPARFGSSYVIEVSGEYLMFDCGPAGDFEGLKKYPEEFSIGDRKIPRQVERLPPMLQIYS